MGIRGGIFIRIFANFDHKENAVDNNQYTREKSIYHGPGIAQGWVVVRSAESGIG